MKRKTPLTLSLHDEALEMKRQKSKAEYQAMYHKSFKMAARQFDQLLQITRVGSKGNEPPPDNNFECFTEHEIQHMDENSIFSPISDERKSMIYTRGSERFSLHSFARKVCAVCDGLYPAKVVKNCEVGGKSARKWVSKLRGLDEIPDAHRREYDVTNWIPQMKGALLSRRGVIIRKELANLPLLQVCQSCYNSLNSSSKNPPKFSIANGFDIGFLPEYLKDANAIEKQMTSMTSIIASITVLRGGRHKVVRGHVTVVTLDPGEICRRLPDLTRGKTHFFVVMAGKFTSRQKILAMKRYKARRDVVQKLLEFYIQNNVLYQDIGVKIDMSKLNSLTEFVAGDQNNLNELDCIFEGSALQDDDTTAVDETFTQEDPGSRCRSADIETKYREECFLAFQANENTTVEILDAAKETLVVRNHGRFVSAFDGDLLALSFPELFPRGRGHPGTKRQVKVSFEECIRHYLRLSCRQFSQHPTFVPVAFDLCGKRRVLCSTTVRSHNKPCEFEEIGKLTREEVMEAIEARKQNRKRGNNEREIGDSQSFKVGTRLFRSVFASQYSMWGSAAEKLSYRRKGFCMDAYMKSGAIFVTITPTDVGTMIVSVLSGKFSVEECEAMQMGSIPNRSRRTEFALKDPVACAEYFQDICDRFFETIVGFDMKKSLPYRHGGLFGVVKSFFGTIETQSSGTLHMHCIVYVAGLPRTTASFKEHCEDIVTGEEFKRRFIALVDSVVTSSIPAFKTEMNDISCPRCKKMGTINPIARIDRAAYRFRSSSQKLIPTSRCDCCESTFGGTELIRNELSLMHKRAENLKCEDLIPLGLSAHESDSYTESMIAVPKLLTRPLNMATPQSLKSKKDLAYLLRISQIALLTQQHNPSHVPSCFKKSTFSEHGECRYNYPRASRQQTYLGKNLKLEIGRKFHHEYINPYNEVILSFLGSNHDIRFLVGSGTTDALYYCMKYLTKVTEDVDCLDAIAMTYFDRRIEEEEHFERSGASYSAKQCGTSRVKSIAIALSRMQQIPATMCAVYLKRHSGMYSSHQFVPFHLGQTMAIFEKAEYDAVLVCDQEGAMIQATQLKDYLFRPEWTKSMSMIDFVTKFVRVRRSRQSLSCDIPEHLGFLEGHPLRSSHVLQQRSGRVIPDIIGPRLPDRTKLQDSVQKERFGLIAMILTKPFSRKDPILPKESSFWEAFCAFEQSVQMTPTRKKYLENLQEYYISKAEAEREREISRTEQSEDNQPPDSSSDVADDYNLNGFLDTEMRNEESTTTTISEALKGVIPCFNSSLNRIITSERTRSCIQTIASSDNNISNRDMLWPGYNQLDDSEKHESEDYAADIRKAKANCTRRRYLSKDIRSDKECTLETSLAETSLRDRNKVQQTSELWAETNIECADHYTGTEKKKVEASCSETKASQTADGTSSNKSSEYLSPDSVIRKFTLNRSQSVAFKEIVQQLLTRICQECRGKECRPFAMFLGGEGGSGKSRVIEAVSCFAKSWDSPGAVRTCAPTGVAATLVQGQTFHSFAKIFERGNSRRRKTTKSFKLVEEFQDLELLFIDEVSMLARKFVAKLDSFLREVKEKPNHRFGNVMVVFCGDFYQIPPVGSDAVYIDPRKSNFKTTIEDRIGFDIWKSLDSVIILEKNMRQSTDKQYSKLLRRLRYGHLTQEDLDLLNTRVVSNHSQRNPNPLLNVMQPRLYGTAPMVVRTNELRNALNWQCVKQRAKALGITPIVCVADVRARNRNLFSKRDLQILFKTNDTQTGNLPVLLPLLPGMPVRITQNIAVEMGIANVSEGRLLGIQFDARTKFEASTIFDVNCLVPNALPLVAFVEVNTSTLTGTEKLETVPKNFSKQTVPLFPVEIQGFQMKLRKVRLDAGSKLAIKQFPLVPSYSSTTYKIQGITTPRLIMFPLLSGTGGKVPQGTLYVILSRVRSLEGLYLMEEITDDHRKYFVPSQSLITEEKRLIRLHWKTFLNQTTFEIRRCLSENRKLSTTNDENTGDKRSLLEVDKRYTGAAKIQKLRDGLTPASACNQRTNH